jgi:hypothetical protein
VRKRMTSQVEWLLGFMAKNWQWEWGVKKM